MSGPVLIEERAVGRKTPLDGRLELSASAAARVGALGEHFTVLAADGEDLGRIETLECTCGKQPGAKPGDRHVHHFVASPLLRGLVAGDAVRIELDAARGALLVRPA